MSSFLNPLPPVGAPAPAAVLEKEAGSDVSQNAFMLILMIMLQHMGAQQERIELGLEKEEVLKGEFDAQNEVVKAAQAELRRLIEVSKQTDPTDSKKIDTDLRKIQAQMAQVQAEESKLSFSRGKMVTEFKNGIDPSQTMIKEDSIMFGGALHSYLLTERTRK